MARITIDVDLTPEVEITGYQRYQDGHGLEVRWPLPARCRCEKCGHDDVAHIEFKTSPQAIRDLNLWEQPCFWIYQAPFHRCARCNYRQHIRHFLRCGGQARTVSAVDITAVIGSQLTYCVEVAAELLADVEEQTVRSVHQAQRPG